MDTRYLLDTIDTIDRSNYLSNGWSRVSSKQCDTMNGPQNIHDTCNCFVSLDTQLDTFKSI